MHTKNYEEAYELLGLLKKVQRVDALNVKEVVFTMKDGMVVVFDGDNIQAVEWFLEGLAKMEVSLRKRLSAL